jgi:AAA domain/Ankyrin repeats (many copies)
MRIVTYRDLRPGRFAKALERLRAALVRGDFAAAGLKKLSPTPYWRAKLSDEARLILQFVPYGGQTVCLFLEIIPDHAYEKSRFLRGAPVDRDKIDAGPDDPAPEPEAKARLGFELRWLPPEAIEFDLLDKPIVLDAAQEAVRRHAPPLVVIGPAGSGKTAVTLAKTREAAGDVLYVTLSAYLAQTARRLCGAHGYENPHQNAEFMSFREFVDTIAVPEGEEVRFSAFRAWLDRRRGGLRGDLRQADAHALFEEFRGVLGAPAGGALTEGQYQGLGVRQSLYPAGEARAAVYDLFEKYRAWLKEEKLFDLNLVSHAWRAKAEPRYDFVVVDEVQDFTNAQLALILDTLKTRHHFLLCGDSHQIVHPNFFSWASVRALFWSEAEAAEDTSAAREVSVLKTNFRNTEAVTALANRLLKIKQARFGSVDRESNFLVRCASSAAGEAQLLKGDDKSLRALNSASRASVRYAVIVLRDEDKPSARAHFATPLVFSVHEAKGLEYPNVILFQIISGNRAAYAEVCRDVTPGDLEGEDLDFRRARDKADKSLEINKFYVNALYVALTRAVDGLTIVETDVQHPLLRLLDLREIADAAPAAAQASSKDEWAQEARKLELQGKQEQARAIRETFLAARPTPWTPWSLGALRDWTPKALDPRNPSAKIKQKLLDYALWHGQGAYVEELAAANFAPALALTHRGELLGRVNRIVHEGKFVELARIPGFSNDPRNPMGRATRASAALRERQLRPYLERSPKAVLQDCDLYGVDHKTYCGATPLMLAARAGNVALIETLLARGADAELVDDYGHTAWMGALNRAIDDEMFARAHLAALFERLGPETLDVQTDGRLVRLERGQGEFWPLGLMLAGLKTHCGGLIARPLGPFRYRHGFFADGLIEALDRLPEHLWPKGRRKRDYVNAVLARAEVDSGYRPARKLWKRRRVGYYMPAPDMRLRRRTADGEAWVPIGEALALPELDDGGSGWLFDGYALPEDAQAPGQSTRRAAG